MGQEVLSGDRHLHQEEAGHLLRLVTGRTAIQVTSSDAGVVVPEAVSQREDPSEGPAREEAGGVEA